MVKTSLLVLSVAFRHADATASTCAGVTWVAGGTRQTATNANSNCGQGATAAWGDLQPMPTGGTADADGCAAAACIASNDYSKCCHPSCGFVTFTAGAGTDVAAVGATKATRYCGANKVPIAAQATTAVPAAHNSAAAPVSADLATCCQDSCAKVTFKSGDGTDATPNFYCGPNRIPIASQATVPSGIATNAGAAAQKIVCCNDACGKVSFTAGAGTDDSAATTPKYFCGAGRVPVASQGSKDSGSDAVGAGEKTACCDDSCGKVTFKGGAGTDDSASTTYYCGENNVPVLKQAEVPSGSDSVGSGQKTTCCDNACGKVTFKAGAGTDDSASTTYYCGENKVPVAKQATVPSGSDSVGAGQKGTCCAAACSTATYKAGEGTDADTTFFCGKNKSPKKEQKTLPCNGATCSASGKSHCCAATCASTKWAAGKKPTSPATGTMYCGDGMSPKAALADTVCAGDDCVEATDAGTCCEKTKVNNSSATTDAQTAGASVLLLSAALLMTIQ